MFRTLRNAWQAPDLRRRMLFVVFILILFRLGAVIPVPFVDSKAMTAMFANGEGSLFAYMNILSGDTFSKATLFALGVSPYITASIVIQLVSIAFPALEKLSKTEEGKNKLNQITRIVTVALALVTAFGYYKFMDSYGVLRAEAATGGKMRVFAAFVIVACYTAGSCIVMWLAEKINERGIGNGISLILFVNILASTPTLVAQLINFFRFGEAARATTTEEYYAALEAPHLIKWRIFVIATLVVALAIVVFIIFITNSEHRINIEYAKQTRGRRMVGGQSQNLPIKLNMSGVMPIIIANSIVALPSTIQLIFQSKIKAGGFWDKFFQFFSYESWFYAVMFFILIIAFAYFYIAISFNPVEIANNLQKNGGFIPGWRPGESTARHIQKILNKVTLIGALFLGFIAVFPLVVNMITGTQIASLAFGGSSLLIVVGVILETAREIDAQVMMRHHKGFLQ